MYIIEREEKGIQIQEDLFFNSVTDCVIRQNQNKSILTKYNNTLQAYYL
jgi:hypothetical protein